MKNIKKALSILLATVFIASCFSACSSGESKETENPLVIGYYANDPFITVNEDGTVSGFDQEVFEYAYSNYVTSTDYKGIKYVEVKDGEDFTLGEDGEPTVLIGGIKKNVDDVNQKYTWTDTIVKDSYISLVAKDSKIKSYTDFSDVVVACVGDNSASALNENTAIAKVCKSIKTYETADEAISLLNSGKADVVVIDDFTYNVTDSAKGLTVLDGELGADEYAYALPDWDWFQQDMNYALYKMLNDPDKGDILTPIAEKTFGYNAINIDVKNAPVARR